MSSLYCIAGFVVSAGIFWGVWAAKYFLESQGISGVGRILPSDMSYMIFAVALPIILLFMVAAIVLFAVANHANRAALVALLRSNKGETESLASISKTLILLKKLGLAGQLFSMLPSILGDMAAMVADIIAKTGMASEVVVFDALSKERENRLYAVCRIITDLRESTPHFDENLRRRVKKDESVAAAIAAFAGKYSRLVKVLGDYDVDGLALTAVEGGMLGRVHGILTLPMKDAAEEALGIRPVAE
ncbi:MAG: hypothetical protein LBI17_01375 [Rickettsiales bacterium]|jgi:hypothetical protein|nr:hypothetical protein [Rickettsiales bacterium]